MRFFPCFFSVLLFLTFQTSQAQNRPAITVDTLKKTMAAPAKVTTIAEKVKSSHKWEGLFTLYQDTTTGSVLLYVRKDQLGKEFIYQSIALGGPTSLFLNQNMVRTSWVFQIQKAFDRLEFAQKNTNFYYDPNNAISKAANVDVTEAVFYSDKIAAEDSLGYLISADAMFLSDRLDPIKPSLPPMLPPGLIFNLGNLNPGKSKYEKIRSFSRNTDVIVNLAFENPAPFNPGGKDITDPRYNRIRFQHSFLEMPRNNYRPRRDDPRVGFFTEEVDNLTSTEVPNYKDVIHRWNLVKKDPTAAMSEPVEPIVFWVENTTPVELRQTIVEAGLHWNEAFEQAGFKNAVQMKIMPDTATWDPADLNYNVIRWVSSPTPPYGAIGMSMTNPRTGQILGADIVIEWSSGANYAPVLDEVFNTGAVAEASAPSALVMLAGKKAVPCSLGQELQKQMAAGMILIERDGASPAAMKEIQRQFLLYLVMHEMGHTLGLNHNMKATQMLSPAEINDRSITSKWGLQGSVMDYPIVNIALDPKKQGDYFTSKAGPYDLWAIQYGYSPAAPEEEEAVLTKILTRSGEPKLAFGNDADDMRSPGGGGIDPRVMVFDLTNDMVSYGEDRLKLINQVMGKMKDKFSKPNRSYAELRARYQTLNGQRQYVTAALSRYVGGVYVDRSFVGQPNAQKPFTPVPAAYQKKALEVLGKYLFAPTAFDADAPLFPYLQLQRRGFSFFGTTEDPKPQNTVLALQRGVLAHLLSAVTLQRINTTSLYGNAYSVADVLGDLNRLIFQADINGNVNLYRQNLQTEYVRDLSLMASGPVGTYDDPSRAAALLSLRKIKALLSKAGSPSEQTKAHRLNLNFLIDKALLVK